MIVSVLNLPELNLLVFPYLLPGYYNQNGAFS